MQCAHWAWVTTVWLTAKLWVPGSDWHVGCKLRREDSPCTEYHQPAGLSLGQIKYKRKASSFCLRGLPVFSSVSRHWSPGCSAFQHQIFSFLTQNHSFKSTASFRAFYSGGPPVPRLPGEWLVILSSSISDPAHSHWHSSDFDPMSPSRIFLAQPSIICYWICPLESILRQW